MSFAQEFKEFAVKGNVMDMAVGVIIGAAFGKIVASFVADVVMPVIGLLVGGVDFTTLKYTLQEAVGETAAVTINYGMFIQNVFDFVIIALAVFMAIKGVNNMKKAEEVVEEAPAGPTETELLIEIRDALKK